LTQLGEESIKNRDTESRKERGKRIYNTIRSNRIFTNYLIDMKSFYEINKDSYGDADCIASRTQSLIDYVTNYGKYLS